MCQHVRCWSRIGYGTAFGEEEDIAKVRKKVGAALMNCGDDGTPFFGQGGEDGEDGCGGESVKTRGGLVKAVITTAIVVSVIALDLSMKRRTYIKIHGSVRT